jgi:hypothetical protein
LSRPVEKLLLVVLLTAGCTAKSKITPTTAKPSPESALKNKQVEPVTPSRRYSGQFIYEGQAIDTEPQDRVIRDQDGYDALVETLPKHRIQMKQPAPPNDDPLLQKPPIDFSREMLIVVFRHSMYYGPKIKRVLRGRDGALIVEILHERPEGVMPMASRADVGTYEAVVVPRSDEAPLFRVEEKQLRREAR